jgi:hypothetical protein
MTDHNNSATEVKAKIPGQKRRLACRSSCSNNHGNFTCFWQQFR